MRPLSLLFSASLLVLAASAGAQTLPYPQDTTPISTVQVTAPQKAMAIFSDQAAQIRGDYEMSNGWYMRVRTAPRHIDASIDDRPPIRLVQVSRYQFASRDGNVRMEFNRGNWGDEVLMSYVPDPRLAQVIILSSRMAQR